MTDTQAQERAGLLPVTQADREAAASLIEAWQGEGFKSGHHLQIRARLCDKSTIVQAFSRHRLAALTPQPDPEGRRSALEETTGALQFLLAFYDPNQRYLDTEAWKTACAGAVTAYNRSATELGWCFKPLVARNGEVFPAPPESAS